LFLLSVVPRPSPFLSPFPSRGTAEILNESLLMKATSRAPLPPFRPPGRNSGKKRRRRRRGKRRRRRRRKGQRGKSRGAFPISALHHQRMVLLPPPRDFPPRSFWSFFYLSLRPQTERSRRTTAAKNEIPRFRQKFIFPRAIVRAVQSFAWRTVSACGF